MTKIGQVCSFFIRGLLCFPLCDILQHLRCGTLLALKNNMKKHIFILSGFILLFCPVKGYCQLVTASQMLREIKTELYPAFKLIEQGKKEAEIQDDWDKKIDNLAEDPSLLKCVYEEINRRPLQGKQDPDDPKFDNELDKLFEDIPDGDFEWADWLNWQNSHQPDEKSKQDTTNAKIAEIETIK